jgi:PKD repeat protein
MKNDPRDGARGHLLLRTATVLVALLAGGAFALLSGMYLSAQHSVALACGSGSPVMQANNLLATLDPNTFSSNNGLPEVGGVFAVSYSAGKPIAFVENLSYLPSSAPAGLKLRWSFGDNTARVEGQSTSHTYARAGTYLILVEYYDTTTSSWQFFDYAHVSVTSATLPPNPPTAKASASATSVESGNTISFDATGSQSQDGSSLTYTWDFNDGTRVTGLKATHQFLVPGKTLTELTVTDGRGAKSVALINLVVVSPGGLPSAALLASSTAINPGDTVSFDASQSRLPATLPNDQFVKYVWDFGDGSPQQSTTNPATSHTYKQTGKYTVTLQAYDEQGAAGTATVTIAVGNVATAGSVGSSAGGNANGLWIGLGAVTLAALAAGGYFVVQAQRRRNALIRERQHAMQLARARRVTGRSGAYREAPRKPPARSRQQIK